MFAFSTEDAMKELREAIEKFGIGIGDSIVKVDSFLNHRIDTGLSQKMGEDIAAHFAGREIDLVLTVEASGIAVAIMAAHALGNIPVVFAKKSQSLNVGPDVYIAQVYSFTHEVMNTVRVSRAYLPKGSRVLMVDDFLANGAAMEGMREILRQAECELVGAAVCIEKGFQAGGNRLRAEGVDLYSLAIVDGIDHGRIILRDD